MPRTSILTLHTLIQKLNVEMDKLATLGQIILIRLNEPSPTSVTEMPNHGESREDLERLFEESGEKFRELHHMNEVLLDGFIRKKAELPRAKSLSVGRNSKSKSLRKTRRIKSI